MSRLLTDLDTTDVGDECASSTSEFLLGGIEESEVLYQVSSESGLSVWPICVGEADSVFRDPGLVELGSYFSEQRRPSLGQGFLRYSAPEKVGPAFMHLVGIPISAHILVHEDRAPSVRQTWFSPDFYGIKRRVQDVVWGAAGRFWEEEPLAIVQKVPITIALPVAREAEERNFAEELQGIVELVEQNYSSLKSVDIGLEHDPEITGRKTIRFTLTVFGTPDSVLGCEAAFKKCLRSRVTTRVRELITVTYKLKS